jgi:hypothetical protein
MVALRLIGFVAIGLAVVGVILSISVDVFYVTSALTLFVSGVVFLALDALLVKLDKIHGAVVASQQSPASSSSVTKPAADTSVASRNGIQLQQKGGNYVARGVTFKSIDEFYAWADAQ